MRDYGLQRSEGVLLRYLSEVYKTLSQTVPVPARTDEVMDILAHFRALLREVDSSLLDEWESLKDGRSGAAGAGRRARWRGARRAARPIWPTIPRRWRPGSAPTCTGWCARWPARR